MKTFIRISGQAITSIVSASRLPDGYIEVDESNIPSDLSLDLSRYKYDGDSFVFVPKSEDIVKAELANQARSHRDLLLGASDWTQSPDAPVDSAAWALYRKSLRDLTLQPNFPNGIEWPAPPA